MGKEKECYRLWIEYLKRNDNYKDFCNTLREKKKNPSLSIPEKFKHLVYPANYYMFGDIHNKHWTFEKWWKLYKERASFHDDFPVESYISRKILGVKDEFIPKGIVEDYADHLQSDIDVCIEQFKFYNQGREPTLNEFRELFLNELKGGQLCKYITIRIDPRGKSTQDILNQIRKLIKEKRKNPKIKQGEYKFIHFLKPTTKLRLDDLQKYLNIYDLRQQPGIKPKEIIKRINPEDDADNLEVQRAYRDFYQKAKRIIEFVETGRFPGPYDETTLNRKKRNAKK